MGASRTLLAWKFPFAHSEKTTRSNADPIATHVRQCLTGYRSRAARLDQQQRPRRVVPPAPRRSGPAPAQDYSLSPAASRHKNVLTDSAVLFEWAPALADEAAVQKPVFAEPFRSQEILLNADIVLAPILSSVSPASGSTAAGNA